MVTDGIAEQPHALCSLAHVVAKTRLDQDEFNLLHLIQVGLVPLGDGA